MMKESGKQKFSPKHAEYYLQYKHKCFFRNVSYDCFRSERSDEDGADHDEQCVLVVSVVERKHGCKNDNFDDLHNELAQSFGGDKYFFGQPCF